MKKYSRIILIFTTLAFIVGVGVFLYANNGNEDTQQTEDRIEEKREKVAEKQDSNDNQKEGEVTEIDTSSWLTYRNEEYGFEVKYPEGYIAEEHSNGFSLKADKIFLTPSFEVRYFHNINDYFKLPNNYSQKTFLSIDEFLAEGYEKTEMIFIKKDNLNSIPVTIIGIGGHARPLELALEANDGLYILSVSGISFDLINDINNNNFDLDERAFNPISYSILQSFTLLDPQESL